MSQFKWDSRKIRAAELLAEGDLTQEEVGLSCDESNPVTRFSIIRWLECPEFSKRVDELVEETGLARKSEVIKLCKKQVRDRLNNDDKDSALDWLKQLSKIQGWEKQQVDHTGNISLKWEDE